MWRDSISFVARAFDFSVQILPRRLPSNPSALCTVLRHWLQLFVNCLYLCWWNWNSQCLKLVGRLLRSSWEITIVVSHVRLLSPGMIFLVNSRSRAESVSIVSSLIIVRIGSRFLKNCIQYTFFIIQSICIVAHFCFLL